MTMLCIFENGITVLAHRIREEEDDDTDDAADEYSSDDGEVLCTSSDKGRVQLPTCKQRAAEA